MPGGQQLPGRGGRDTAPEPARATPARTAQRAADGAEELTSRTGAAAADPAPATPAPRSTPAAGTQNNQPE
jgi:hypothetical protein